MSNTTLSTVVDFILNRTTDAPDTGVYQRFLSILAYYSKLGQYEIRTASVTIYQNYYGRWMIEGYGRRAVVPM